MRKCALYAHAYVCTCINTRAPRTTLVAHELASPRLRARSRGIASGAHGPRAVNQGFRWYVRLGETIARYSFIRARDSSFFSLRCTLTLHLHQPLSPRRTLNSFLLLSPHRFSFTPKLMLTNCLLSIRDLRDIIQMSFDDIFDNCTQCRERCFSLFLSAILYLVLQIKFLGTCYINFE